ncbi:hypothetical protein AB0B50_20470 [Streptomyces sp. NPDC041068]|uniref:hypothetical protein n=1 Tax=Streptomyces sp. NPDC041068 TaxID=3155130 RepID=UPI0033E86577
MATRQMRPQHGIVRAVLLALVFLFLVPVFGTEGSAGSSSAKSASDRSVAAVAPAVVPAVRGSFRVEDRGCHEEQPGGPRGAVVPCPEQPGAHVPKSVPAPSGPQDDVLSLPGASPPGTTSVDLYRIQIIRT